MRPAPITSPRAEVQTAPTHWAHTGHLRTALVDIVSPRTWRATGHLVLSLFVGVAMFAVMVPLLTVSVALVVLFPISLILAWLLFFVADQFGRFERFRLRSLLDIDVASPSRPPSTGGWWSRLKARALSGSTWRQIAAGILRLPVGAITFALAVAAWCVPLSLLALPATIWLLPNDEIRLWSGIALHGWPVAVVAGALGIAVLPFVPFVIRTVAALDARLFAWLLGPARAEGLDARVATLTESRSRVMDAVEIDRRRIERDLHDGAQQRLVALAMGLGQAREKFESDPAGAQALVEAAHGEAKRALVELRDLARGIHPAVLTDRGLDAALSSVAARSPVPVTLRVDVSERPDPTIEGIAYFVVCEGLTNVAKHASARRATVTVERRGDRLLIDISDDGHGGADPALGGGLAGLRDRVQGVDGWLQVSSPVGGPTTIMVQLPCAS